MGNFFKKTSIAALMMALSFAFALHANAVQAESQSGQVVFDYFCDALIPFNMELTLNYTAPLSVKPGEEFYIQTQTSSAPEEDLVNLLRLLGALYVSGESLFTPNVENGTYLPADLNLDERQWTPINRTEIPSEGSFRTTVPGDGPGDMGPFIAEIDEGVVKIYAGTINTKLFVFNSDEPNADPLLESVSECHPLDGQDLHFVSIAVDNEAPIITLNGDNPMTVKQGDPYQEHGAAAVDDVDGDLTDQIEISGDVDTNTIGTYTVTYTVSDSVGNIATAERTVHVVEASGSWYTGEGPPGDALGSNGDSYLDLATGDVYKRDPNAWKKVGNIKGADGSPGEPGTKWHAGEGLPDADLGRIGDLYLNQENGDVFEKTAEGWQKIANLTGPQGPQGPPGTSGGDKSADGGSGKTGTSGDGSKSKADMKGKGKSTVGGKLPKTATSLPALLIIGAVLLAAGGVFLLRRRKAIE